MKRYRYKGKLYLLICKARDHHTEQELAVYAPLYYDEEWGDSTPVSVRTWTEFVTLFEEVK